MRRNDFYYPSADGLTRIHAAEWLPAGAPRAVLQICHGMTEYIGRYEGFASYLAERGFYVTGNDHLGHGESVRPAKTDLHGYFSHPDGNECVIADIHTLRTRTRERFPDLPYFFLGHSMGSFLTRQYIELHGEGLSGAVIMGTGTTPGPVLLGGMGICRFISCFRGWQYRSVFVDRMAGGSFTRRIKPLRTPKDWLTKDQAIVNRYIADPNCTFLFTVNAYYQMFRGMRFMQRPDNTAKIPKDLPLFLVSGAEDPVGNYGKGVAAAFAAYRKAGLSDVSMKLYPNDRHELLNETDREVVYADLLLWFLKHLPNSEQDPQAIARL